MTFKKDWKAYLKASRIETQKAKKADKALSEYKKAKKEASSAWKTIDKGNKDLIKKIKKRRK